MFEQGFSYITCFLIPFQYIYFYGELILSKLADIDNHRGSFVGVKDFCY